jgi:hypothetical protein
MGKYDPERTFKFTCGPDDMVAELHRFSDGPMVRQLNVGKPYISFHGKGPRGGWVGGASSIDAETMDKLDDMIADAKGWPYRCKGCGRAEDDCSADPCATVIADREA